MSAKSSNKKNSAATWYFCERCNIHLTTNARDRHENICAIDVDTQDAIIDYINDGTLCTSSMEELKFKVDNLENISSKYFNNLLFISEGAIRLSNLHIGQQVIVEAQGTKRALVRTIWPIAESFLTTVFIPPKDYYQNWTQFRSKIITIKALTSEMVGIAKSVRLNLHGGNTNFETSQLKDASHLFKQEFKNLIFECDETFNFNFFNKHLELKICDWENMIPLQSSELELCLKDLRLHDPYRFLKIVHSTKVEIVSHKQQNAKAEDILKPLITKEKIGALDKEIKFVEQVMDYALGFQKLPQGLRISRGVLLYGNTGCGKTMICEAMCALIQDRKISHIDHYETLIVRINSSELYSKFLGETEKNLSLLFEQAYNHYPQPTLILLENVHILCPKYENSEIIKRVSAVFLSMLDQLSSRLEAQRIFILATTSQIDALNSSIRRCGRLDTEIEIAPPTPNGRLDILNCLLKEIEHDLKITEIEQIASVTHGFVGADISTLLYTALLKSLKRPDGKLNKEDIDATLIHIKPSAMREVLFENPNVKWSDIGGQLMLKQQLQQAIEWPLLHPHKFIRLGIKPPRGILMFGPPGCSKTMIAKALATESHLNFLSIKGPELFSMWVGESERAVRDVFRKARQVAPAIIFFDEIDAIGGERSGDASGSSGASVKERVLTQLLTELDGVETLKNVTIVAATNRPDMIDKALLRPGRIDRIIYVGLPNSDARKEILSIKLKKMPLANDMNMENLVERTNGYSGAEIQAVCQEAALKALENNFEAECVTMNEFEYALNEIRPRTSPELLKLYEQYISRS